jgi:CubicO group peptidase (beta-lactamase class C family)
MWEQTGDLYKWTLELNMVRNPGEKGVYCSTGANLVAGVVSRAANQHTATLLRKLITDPLGMKTYYQTVAPSKEEFTFTGGAKFLLRDFLKLAQLHLNGGVWHGKRIYSREWSDRATSELSLLGKKFNRKYGYLWWLEDYQYKGHPLRAYFAAGNGGQISMGIPELDLAVAFFGGNYNSDNTFTAQRVYVPRYILPAIIQ